MKRYITYMVSALMCSFILLLSGCDFIWTTSNGDPASPDDVKAGIEKEFKVCNPQLVLQSSVVEKEKPFSGMCMCFMMNTMGSLFRCALM